MNRWRTNARAMRNQGYTGTTIQYVEPRDHVVDIVCMIELVVSIQRVVCSADTTVVTAM